MKNTLKKLSWLFLLPLTAQLLSAQPSGYVILDFDGISTPVWDLSGPMKLDAPAIVSGGQELPVIYTVMIDHQVNGALRGSGSTIVQIGTDMVAASYTLSGSVNGSSTATRVTFSVTLKGRGIFAGAERNFTVSTTYKMMVSDWGGLEGSANGSLKISGSGSGKIRMPEYYLDMPGGATGDWRLVLNYVPFKRFSGVGAVYVTTYFPDNSPTIDSEEYRVFPGKVSGSYSESKDLTSGKFTGTGSGRGVAVDFKVEGYNTWLSGTAKLLGQRLRL